MALAGMTASPLHAEPLAVPGCLWDRSAQVLSPSRSYGGTEELVYPELVANDYVSWVVNGPAGELGGGQIVLQHCRSDLNFQVALPADDTTAFDAYEAYANLLYSDANYTFEQFSDVLRPLGASAQVSRNELGDCGCAHYGYGQ